jgi:hypothetical protein
MRNIQHFEGVLTVKEQTRESFKPPEVPIYNYYEFLRECFSRIFESYPFPQNLPKEKKRNPDGFLHH